MELGGTAVDRKANHAHQVVDDIAKQATEKAAPAIDRVAQAAHRTVDKVASAAGPAADWMTQSTDQLKQQQDALLESCRGYVRERPLVVLGAAAVAGYLFGRLTR